MNTLIWSLVILGGLGILFGAGLGIAAKKLAVDRDERIDKVRECLPGANCGGCGFPGCDGLAAAIVEGKAVPTACAVCSKDNITAIGDIMGIEVEMGERKVARVLCQGGVSTCTERGDYRGMTDCRGAHLVSGGTKECVFGCMGLGSCVKVCKFDAIKINEDGVAIVDESLCTGCGSCVSVCPKHVITLLPASKKTYVRCANPYFGKQVLNTCTAGCIGCKLCAKNCPEGAITMVNNLPVIDLEKCTDCGLCAEKCRAKCIAP